MYNNELLIKIYNIDTKIGKFKVDIYKEKCAIKFRVDVNQITYKYIDDEYAVNKGEILSFICFDDELSPFENDANTHNYSLENRHTKIMKPQHYGCIYRYHTLIHYTDIMNGIKRNMIKYINENGEI